MNMLYTEYHLYLCVATVSGLVSTFMIYYLCRNTKNLRVNLITQALISYGIFDIIGTISWYLGDKYDDDTLYIVCCIQEYMFQASNLLKAFTTVMISYMTYEVVLELKSPKMTKKLMKLLLITYSLPAIFLGLSIYYQSASLFCGTSDEDKDNIAYVAVFLPPLYICVAINCVMYKVIKSRTKRIIHFFSVIYHTSPEAMDAQLLLIVSKLRIYPIIFCFCWLPEVTFLLLKLLIDSNMIPLRLMSGILINSSGTLVAMGYFYRQYYKRYIVPSPNENYESSDSDPASRSSGSGIQNPMTSPWSPDNSMHK